MPVTWPLHVSLTGCKGLSSSPAWHAGDQFALFESVVALAMLMRRFTFSMAPGAPAVGMTTVRLPCMGCIA